jgi:hypothetical protein
VRQGAQRVGKCAAAVAALAEMKIQGEFYGFFLIRGSCVVICYILIMVRGNERPSCSLTNIDLYYLQRSGGAEAAVENGMSLFS